MVYRDWNRWNDEGFTFLESDVSTSWVYLLSQMLFWQLMYLHWPNIRCCRCSFGDQCIYKALIFIAADVLLGINVYATYFSSNLQILLSLPVMHNCIYILPFLGFKDTPFANFASSISENPLSQISSLNILCCYSLHNLSQYITYKKIDIRNSSEYEMSVGDT